MIATVRRARHLEGEVKLPGDKSVSHRALILGSIANGRSRLRGLSGIQAGVGYDPAKPDSKAWREFWAKKAKK